MMMVEYNLILVDIIFFSVVGFPIKPYRCFLEIIYDLDFLCYLVSHIVTQRDPDIHFINNSFYW